ncbi:MULTISPECIES: DUF3426 domain-containing protein [unclassified Acinetobacter]|uniref:DUF3426 domain-containing protein n=1 Tax=unclassified Acinetobacter TaxID=196816 RepID=UPI001C22ECD2|nr:MULTISPECIES: DUF3426 domain-containing protein [unclassified Acinetobacter]
MSDKRTHCPTCSTTYKVTVAQLTIAQGMVCCPKCTTSFNALSHLVTEARNSVTTSVSHAQLVSNEASKTDVQNKSTGYSPDQQHNRHSLLQIFDQKVEHSNIDLETYLNNLNYFSTELISALPSMNWEDQAEKQTKHGPMYYIGWSLINLSLFSLLLFQFFWFNPQYIKNSHVMSLAFNSVCEVFNCSNLEKYYTLIQANKVKIKATSKNETEFSGELINFHDRSLALPILRINLEHRGEVVATYNLSSKEYLIESLVNIERIPKNSPFKFKFKLPVDRKSFDRYTLEIIRP